MSAPSADLIPIEELESMFKSRYTEQDTAYVEAERKPLDPPPTVVNWYSRPKRIFDWASRNEQRGGYRGHDRGHRGHDRGHRGHYQGNRDYHGNRDNRRDNRGNYHGHRGGQHRDQQSHQRYNEKRQYSDYGPGGGPSSQGPSRVFYPGMKDFEEAQNQAQERYHPYQRGSQSNRGSHRQGDQSQSRSHQSGQSQHHDPPT